MDPEEHVPIAPSQKLKSTSSLYHYAIYFHWMISSSSQMPQQRYLKLDTQTSSKHSKKYVVATISSLGLTLANNSAGFRMNLP